MAWPWRPSCPNRRASRGVRVVPRIGPRLRHNEIMTMSSPFVIILSADERRDADRPGPRRQRPRTATCCAPGSCWPPPTARPNAAIAADLGVCMTTPSGSGGAGSASAGWTGWRDLPRPGRPRRFTAVAGGRGEGAGVRAARRQPDCRWRSGAAPSWPPRRAARHGRVGVGLHGAPLAGRRRDQAVAAPVLDLPPRPRLRGQGRPRAGPVRPHLRRRAARRRRLRASAPTRNPACRPAAGSIPAAQPGPGRQPMRVESEYRRHGTLAYLAAYDVHRAQVIGHCAPTTGIEPFTELVDQGHDQRALRHRAAGVLGRRQRLLPPRLDRRRPAAATPSRTRTMVHLPVHASWLNQVEIYFSVVQRKAAHPRRLRRPRRTRRTDHRIRTPLQRTPPDPSTGASTATTSTDSSTASGSTTGTHRPRAA